MLVKSYKGVKEIDGGLERIVGIMRRKLLIVGRKWRGWDGMRKVVWMHGGWEREEAGKERCGK